MKILKLISKSIQTYKNHGLQILIKKVVLFIKTRLFVHKPNIESSNYREFTDVLFINGTFLPHPYRYRVLHQREQLSASNISSSEVFYENIHLDMVKYHRVFIFYRCPITQEIEEMIGLIKKENKVSVFDIDDLLIDTIYTKDIPFLGTMSTFERESYDDGVIRTGKTLKLCDYGLVSTDRLKVEMSKYIDNVFINRNTASEQMIHLSEVAYSKIFEIKKQSKLVKLGYFSGSITHNDDFGLINHILVEILRKYSHVELYLIGELDIPSNLKPFLNRIKTKSFMDWKELPNYIASVDINLVPLVDSVFNEAKSENKWIEASLVRVPTIASNVGAFSQCIEDGYNGILCRSEDEWFEKLCLLIEKPEYRNRIGNSAYQEVLQNHTTVYTSSNLASFVTSIMRKNITFVLPSRLVSGGVYVILKHASILKRNGFDVLLINDDIDDNNIEFENDELSLISRHKTSIHGDFDIAVASLWSTLTFLQLYPNIDKRYYFVQSFETDFYKPGQYFKIAANSTYYNKKNISYVTMSKWCECWLKQKFGHSPYLIRNGIDFAHFKQRERSLSDRIVLLVEGNPDDEFKNVDESFRIISQLNNDNIEVWLMAYTGELKPWYKVDKFLKAVPRDEISEIYYQADILLKTSKLESFSYPPLEMMATGGLVVVAENQGNQEYVKNGYNCLSYNLGNIDLAVSQIELLIDNVDLRNTLYRGGIQTAKDRDWNLIKPEILKTYN